VTSDRITRDSAVRALRAAAAWQHTPVADLRVADYRAFRAHAWDEGRPPSELAVSLLFGGWRRACERAGRSTVPPDVEQEVRGRLYGSPERRP
jgi:hypothetical protein